MECDDLSTVTFATWQIGSCLLCKFFSPGASPLSFPSIFRSFRQENRIVELFYWSKFRDRKENEIFASQAKNMQGLVIGREITTVPTKDSVDSWCCSFHCRCEIVSLVHLQFCADFLWIYQIEVNSLAVWLKQVKRFKGQLIFCSGKQENLQCLYQCWRQPL